MSIRLIPLLSVLCLIGAVALFLVSEEDLLQRFVNLTVWSGGFTALTWGFALTAVAGLATVRARKAGIHRGVYVHALASPWPQRWSRFISRTGESLATDPGHNPSGQHLSCERDWGYTAFSDVLALRQLV